MRTRHQDGWVEERGGRVRKWYGHYFVYTRDETGKETRHRVGVSLGRKIKAAEIVPKKTELCSLADLATLGFAISLMTSASVAFHWPLPAALHDCHWKP
jgi:hypothetical protein